MTTQYMQASGGGGGAAGQFAKYNSLTPAQLAVRAFEGDRSEHNRIVGYIGDHRLRDVEKFSKVLNQLNANQRKQWGAGPREYQRGLGL